LIQGEHYKLVHRFIGNGHSILLPQPLPNGFVTGKALRLGQMVTEGALHGWGQERCFAWGFANRQHLGEAAARLRGQPASDGIAIDPKEACHLATGAGLLGLEEIEGLQALVLLGIALAGEERFQFRSRFVNRRSGRFHGQLLRSEIQQ
jgi:hypothetical protein